jgi:hypothetical protein
MAAALPLVHAEGIFLEGVGGRALIRLLLRFSRQGVNPAFLA